MAYCIFLKSLRILEEFRKNPTSKFLLNLLVQVSKAFYKIQKSYFILKGIFADFGPNGPAATQPIGPFGLAGLLLPPRSEIV
jgi:hypothetical protein